MALQLASPGLHQEEVPVAGLQEEVLQASPLGLSLGGLQAQLQAVRQVEVLQGALQVLLGGVALEVLEDVVQVVGLSQGHPAGFQLLVQEAPLEGQQVLLQVVRVGVGLTGGPASGSLAEA